MRVSNQKIIYFTDERDVVIFHLLINGSYENECSLSVKFLYDMGSIKDTLPDLTVKMTNSTPIIIETDEDFVNSNRDTGVISIKKSEGTFLYYYGSGKDRKVYSLFGTCIGLPGGYHKVGHYLERSPKTNLRYWSIWLSLQSDDVISGIANILM